MFKFQNSKGCSSSSSLFRSAAGKPLHQISISLYPALSVACQAMPLYILSLLSIFCFVAIFFVSSFSESSWLFCTPTCCCHASLLGGLPISTFLMWFILIIYCTLDLFLRSSFVNLSFFVTPVIVISIALSAIVVLFSNNESRGNNKCLSVTAGADLLWLLVFIRFKLIHQCIFKAFMLSNAH